MASRLTISGTRSRSGRWTRNCGGRLRSGGRPDLPYSPHRGELAAPHPTLSLWERGFCSWLRGGGAVGLEEVGGGDAELGSAGPAFGDGGGDAGAFFGEEDDAGVVAGGVADGGQ